MISSARRYGVWIPGLLACLLLGGCRPAAPEAPQGRLARPAPGYARIMVTRLEETPERTHWKWSVLGDRNWRRATATATGIALEQTYALNDPAQRGGCFTWECDLQVEAAADALRWSLRAHGSNGFTATGAGTAPRGASTRLLLERDLSLALPATQPIAAVGDQKIALTLAP